MADNRTHFRGGPPISVQLPPPTPYGLASFALGPGFQASAIPPYQAYSPNNPVAQALAAAQAFGNAVRPALTAPGTPHPTTMRVQPNSIAANPQMAIDFLTDPKIAGQGRDEMNISYLLRNAFSAPLKLPAKAVDAARSSAGRPDGSSLIAQGLVRGVADLAQTPGGVQQDGLRRLSEAFGFDKMLAGQPRGGGNAMPTTAAAAAPVMALAFNGLPGEGVTSTYRDPEHNARVGGVPNSFHTQRGPNGEPLARDSVPPPGMSMAQYAAELKRRNPGMDVINEGDHVHMEPSNSMASAIRQAGGMLGDLGRAAFDPTYYNQALGAVDQATAAALQPQTVSFGLPDAPEMPAPILPEKTDFTKVDAALEALRPLAPDEQQRRRTMRANVWQAIGQGLAQSPDGAGLGKVLAMVGGAALAGRGRGLEEWQGRLDAYEDKMRQFNGLVLNNETMKAQTVRREAEAEAQTLNTFGLQKWQQAMQQWSKFNDVRATEGGFIVTTLKDGQVTSTFTPNRGAVIAQGALKKAGLFGQMAGDQNASMRSALSPLPGMITGMVSQQWMEDRAMRNDPEANASLPQMAGLFAADIVENGYAPQVLGEEDYAALVETTRERLSMANPALLGSPKEYQMALNDALTGSLTELMVKAAHEKNTDLLDRFGTYGSLGAGIRRSRQAQERKTTVKQDARGRTTRSTTYEGE